MANFVTSAKGNLINLDLVQAISFDPENKRINYKIDEKEEQENYATIELYDAAKAQIETLIIQTS